MEIANQITKSKHEAEQAARKSYRELLIKDRPDNVVSEEDVAATIAAMERLGITPAEAEADATAWKAVITVQADRDAALAESERLGPKGELSFGQELDNMDSGLARDINALLEPKRVLLARIERFDAAAEVLKSKDSLLATKKSAVPRLTG